MYHVAINGVQQGPLSEAEMRERIARGELKPADLCWQAGWPAWRKVGEVFPAGTEPPPLSPSPRPGSIAAPPVAAAPAPVVALKTSGLATASLVCGICTLVLFPLFFLFMIPAIICGIVALVKIGQSRGALGGGGRAIAGLIMGGLGIVMIPIVGLMAAMAIPAFQKVRQNSLQSAMYNDARQIGSAAQQYFMENSVESVPFTYDRATGTVGGPLSAYVKVIKPGYNVTPDRLTTTDDFQLGHPKLGPPREFSPEGQAR